MRLQDWSDHDPKLRIEALKDMKVYVSSGSGKDDYGNYPMLTPLGSL